MSDEALDLMLSILRDLRALEPAKRHGYVSLLLAGMATIEALDRWRQVHEAWQATS